MAPILQLIPKSEFDRIRSAALPNHDRLQLIADMCRANTLAAVKRAGSGHLGSSFSAMDIVVWLYYHAMNTLTLGTNHPDRDVYFSSKGHDVPGFYSVLFSAGVVSREKFLKLRRLNGLHGHPDISTEGIEANSGSLGMGISKGRGMAWAKQRLGRGGHVFVLTGDGELQEGQNYEALQTTVQQQVTDLTVIVDNNKVQSDKPVNEIVGLGDLESKLRAFGWYVARCNGNDVGALEQTFAELESVTDKPKILIADTIKGRGVSFMEHPAALKSGGGYYKWHAGAPDDTSFNAAYDELTHRLNEGLKARGLDPLKLETMEPVEETVISVPLNALGEPISQGGTVKPKTSAVSNEYVAEAYGKALVAAAESHPELVVLDGDLAADCRVREFELTYPDRFIENGIAEQDMVSMAGGLARQGLLPVVNSFASFLASRANEQIYNNASEQTKIIYACHYAGLIPAGPGKSHQSLRDIALLGSLPNCTIIQPGNASEARLAVDYCVNEANENCVLRLNIGPSPRLIQLPDSYKFTKGQGVSLTAGHEAVLFAYGPVMLHEALLAAEILSRRGYGLQVINMPWLNRFDVNWLRTTLEPHNTIYVLEDHGPVGGLADRLLAVLVGSDLLPNRRMFRFAVEGYPACGTPSEALQFHKLDGASLADRILVVE
jgi:transketolase